MSKSQEMKMSSTSSSVKIPGDRRQNENKSKYVKIGERESKECIF